MALNRSISETKRLFTSKILEGVVAISRKVQGTTEVESRDDIFDWRILGIMNDLRIGWVGRGGE